MDSAVQIIGLQHYSLAFKDAEELSAAKHFYEAIGFGKPVKEEPKFILFVAPKGSELHLCIDERLPVQGTPSMVHANFDLNDVDAAWKLWTDLWQSGFTDPASGKKFPLTKEPYKDFPIPRAKDRFHAFDPWGHHFEFTESKEN